LCLAGRAWGGQREIYIFIYWRFIDIERKRERLRERARACIIYILRVFVHAFVGFPDFAAILGQPGTHPEPVPS
jgi:hypothetical protein